MGLNLDNYGMQLRLVAPSTVPDLFGIEGLKMANLAVEAMFSPAQGPVPTQVGFSGRFVSLPSMTFEAGRYPRAYLSAFFLNSLD